MLLRSSSTPIQNSWLPQYCGKESFSPEPEFRILQRSRSFDSSSSTKNRMTKKQAFSSETSLHKKNTKLVKMAPPSPSPSPSLPDSHNNKKETDQEKEENIQWLLSSSGLGEKVLFNNDYDRKEEEEFGVQAMVTGGGGVGRAGGKICGTGGVSDGGGGSGSVEKYNNNHNNNYNSNNLGSYSTDAYYQKMIEANPDNSLLLGNYAKFLKEVKGDYARAEEYCGRAILSNPGDGDMLSVYADLIWQTQKDAERAESYFDQAVKTSPGDCYVLASYARFLWDAEEEVEEGKDNETSRYGTEASHVCPPDSFHGLPHLPSLTAAT